jgi:hypothetical protein
MKTIDYPTGIATYHGIVIVCRLDMKRNIALVYAAFYQCQSAEYKSLELAT